MRSAPPESPSPKPKRSFTPDPCVSARRRSDRGIENEFGSSRCRLSASTSSEKRGSSVLATATRSGCRADGGGAVGGAGRGRIVQGGQAGWLEGAPVGVGGDRLVGPTELEQS